MPTRNARNGSLFTSRGRITIKRAEFARDPRPLDEDCPCYTCRNFSLSYLRHLYQAGEILAACLHTQHNLRFYLDLMRGAREAIDHGRYPEYKREMLARMNPNEERTDA